MALSVTGCAQKLDCSNLRKGTFETLTESVGNVIVERTDSQHIELIPSIDKKTIYTIKWTSVCEFVIEYLSGDVPPGPNAKRPIKCEIIEVGEDFHIVRARIDGTEFQSDYEMKEIRN